MNTEYIIKKYPNRRLYDTTLSQYVSLDKLHQLVLENTHFRVVDTKTGQDITRKILLQIITEQEQQGLPILSTELLEKLIRFYGNAWQVFLSQYLENNMESMLTYQESMRKQWQAMFSSQQLFTEVMTRNMTLWHSENQKHIEHTPFDIE